MSRSVNKVILLGHLGKDAESKFTGSGTHYAKFSMATTRRYKDAEDWKDKTEWHNIVLWRNEGLAPFLLKGKQVYIEGRLETRSWEDKEGQKRYTTEVVADEVILLGGKGEQADAPVSRPKSSPASGWIMPAQGDGGKDVPF